MSFKKFELFSKLPNVVKFFILLLQTITMRTLRNKNKNMLLGGLFKLVAFFFVNSFINYLFHNK